MLVGRIPGSFLTMQLTSRQNFSRLGIVKSVKLKLESRESSFQMDDE